MKVTLNWLKQYVDFDWSPEELAERLTMLGLEVEGIHKISGEFEGIIVAQVITRDKHPNADKLSLCRVNDGKGERQIVCGADNFKPGDKVPLILPGASSPLKPGEKEPFTIKVGKIRGVESHGMMCSPKELALAEDAAGLLILRPDAKVGQPFAEYLGRSGGDVVLDLEVTPNRPDLNSVIGIAREIAAVTGNRLRLPEVNSVGTRSTASQTSFRKDGDAVERVPTTSELVAVRIEDAELCPRYTARVIKGVKIGPSPDWLRATLEKVGIRSISNVVDVTNYVMLEIGQPLHAFDYHLIAKGAGGKPTIVVRRAAAGEKFQTLDNVERTLTSEMLLIADEQKGIALAGVMGGANTEINNQTVDVLIESAYFSPTNIRRTSKQLGVRSESSYRFERGADIGICDWASQRAAQLILETAGGQLAEGVVDAHPNPVQPRQITLRHQKVNALLGVSIAPDEQIRLLESLRLWRTDVAGPTHVPLVEANVDTRTLLNKEVIPGEGASVTFLIPTWRVDLKREADLIEEIERLYGLEKIPATPPRGAIGRNAFDSEYDQIADARRILIGLGLNEAQGQTLISDKEARLTPEPVKVFLSHLSNPLSSDQNVLRPGLIPCLLHSLRVNALRGNQDIKLFEIGKKFWQEPDRIDEQQSLAIAITGQKHPQFWSGAERGTDVDIFDLKGIIEEFLEQFGIRGVKFQILQDLETLTVGCAAVVLGNQELGRLWQMYPPRAKEYDLKRPVFLAEFSLGLLILRRNPAKSFKPLPQFPSVRRDVAMLVPEVVTHDGVLLTVKQAKPANLEAVELFDVFRGKNVPEGQKSLAYAFTYRSLEKTLTDAEVNATHRKVVDALKAQLKAAIRE